MPIKIKQTLFCDGDILVRDVTVFPAYAILTQAWQSGAQESTEKILMTIPQWSIVLHRMEQQAKDNSDCSMPQWEN